VAFRHATWITPGCAKEEFAMTFYDIDEGFAHAGIEEAWLGEDERKPEF